MVRLMLRFLWTAGPVLAVIIASAGTGYAIDRDAGLRLARKWCAQCHVVENDQSTASADVPSFEGVSNRSDFDTDKLKAFLTNPHPVMPDMHLSRLEIEDLAAYIASLKN
jgi:mono/diheme cytochrome c family protein